MINEDDRRMIEENKNGSMSMYYIEDGEIVARWVNIKIPHTIIPSDAVVVPFLGGEVAYKGERDWCITFTHPSFPVVPEGATLPSFTVKKEEDVR